MAEDRDKVAYEARMKSRYNPKTQRISTTYHNSGGYGKPYPVDVSDDPNEVTLQEYNEQRANAGENVAGYGMQKTLTKHTLKKWDEEEGKRKGGYTEEEGMRLMRTKSVHKLPKKPEEQNDSTEVDSTGMESNTAEQERALKRRNSNMFGL